MQRIIGLVFCLYALVAGTEAQDCSGILGAVRDVSQSEGAKSHFASFKRFFCEQTFTSYQQARDAGVKLEVPIEDLPVSFQGHDKTSSWSEYQHSVCESVETFDSLDVTWKTYLARANAAVVEAWKSCVNSSGLHFWAEVNEDDPKAVTLAAQYISSGAPYQTRITSPISFSGDGVKCPKRTFTRPNVDSARQALDCSRIDEAVAVNITLHTKNGDPTIRLASAAKSTETAPSIRSNVFVPNAMISVDTDLHGIPYRANVELSYSMDRPQHASSAARNLC
jgi:hypothetical protein